MSHVVLLQSTSQAAQMPISTQPFDLSALEEQRFHSGKPGHDFTLTATFEDLSIPSYDAFVIPGGRAPECLALNEKVFAFVKEFIETGKPDASICHGQ
ncbi:hypothetical protein VitviT2T_026636 [Vitis vinifera]|uniref:DJ-1/PfpI domain-containing protein n=1 Tax=Vitis vinifera TaxID=29760 RepID=A0ABY9DRC2_VITVI|nr:hypothetical protein VitviT2T_026636 [Vitis vinifera]